MLKFRIYSFFKTSFLKNIKKVIIVFGKYLLLCLNKKNEMVYIIAILYILLFSWLIYKMKFFHFKEVSRRWILFAFLIKIIAGFALTSLYTFHYKDEKTGDIHKYFDDGVVLYSALESGQPSDYFKMLSSFDDESARIRDNYYFKMNSWYREYEKETYNDNHTIIRFNALLMPLSFKNLWIMTILVNFISFIGIVLLFKTFLPFFKQKVKLLYFSIFLIPSFVFWSSGNLKESFLIFSIGILFYSFFKVIHFKAYKNTLTFGIALFIMFFIKNYIILMLIPLFLAYSWVESVKSRYVFIKYVLVLSTFLFLIIFISSNTKNFDVLKIISEKQSDFINLAKEYNAGSYIDIPKINNSWANFIINIPISIINVVFRPHLFESKSFLYLFSALENILILLLLLNSLIFFRFPNNNKNIWYFSLFFTLILFVLIGLTTPVIGAMVRYKIPVLPFLLMFIFIMFDRDLFLSTHYGNKISLFIEKIKKLLNFKIDLLKKNNN